MRTITLERAARRNALDPEHLHLLARAFADVEHAPDVRCVVVAGEGSAFCAGYDLASPFPPEGPLPDSLVVRAMGAVRECRVPVIARVHGPAFGAGLELALGADVRLGSENASFCLPPARLGIAYAAPGLARLAALVGTSHARRMVFTGEIVSAARALALGLVDEIAADLDTRVEALANAIADNAPLAVQAMKRTFGALERLPPELLEAADRDRARCYASADAAEGLAAFTERRAPDFRGV